jgi:hypothetical protein
MRREDWAKAYFEQACSDWSIFVEFHGREDIPRAQALHYLQMATEKLAKAYRLCDSLTNLETILTSHVGFPEFFNTFLRAPSMRREFKGRDEQLRQIQRDCQSLARAVEQLAPAVDRLGHPANAEYPWEEGGKIVAPVSYSFPSLSLLREARGRWFLNFVERAFFEYSQRS